MQRNQPDNVLGLEGSRYLLTLSFVAPTSSTTMTSAGRGAQGTMRSLIENQGFSHTLVQEGTFHPTALIFKWSLWNWDTPLSTNGGQARRQETEVGELVPLQMG